jgi:hypothetical protein
MSDPGDKLERSYRSLAREEPPAALDRSILAASRRAVAARPALARRWAAPVSIAAVLVLGFGVTLQMQREEPGVESSEPARALPASPPAAAAPAVEEARTASNPARPDSARAVPAQAPEDKLRRKSAIAAPQRSLDANVAPAANEARVDELAPRAFPDSTAAATPVAPAPSAAAGAPAMTREARPVMRMKEESAAAAVAPAPPERELERIARLREDGRHAEADKALEEFRRDHPRFRIPDALWERVRPR